MYCEIWGMLKHPGFFNNKKACWTIEPYVLSQHINDHMLEKKLEKKTISYDNGSNILYFSLQNTSVQDDARKYTFFTFTLE